MAKLEGSRISRRGLAPAQQLYLEYWTAFRDLLEGYDGVVNPVKPLAQSDLQFGVGRSGFHITVIASVRGEWICVRLVLNHQDSLTHFYLLERDKVDIEKEFGAKLEWEEKPGFKEKHIRLLLYNTDLEDRQDWHRQHRWLCEQLETFHRVFSRRVKELDANDYLPEEDETDE